MSETLGNELMAALAKAQGEMSNAPFDATNPHFRSKYATLASIRDATIPHLAKYGLSIHQITKLNGDGMVLATRLAHASGQWIESVYPLPNSNKPHEMGSAITYARRYSWAAICGVAAEEDDDANAAQEGAKNGTPPAKRTRQEISNEANRKRQEYRDVEQDLLQIDNLAALDRYSREVLTPDFMAALGMKQWAVEQKVGERRRELENGQKAEPSEEPQEDDAPTHGQVITYGDCAAWIRGTQSLADMPARITHPGYVTGLEQLTEAQKTALRGVYKERVAELRQAQTI